MSRRKLGSIAVERGLVGGPFGSSLVSDDYTSSGVPVIRGTNMGHGRFVGGEFAYVSLEKFERDLSRNTAEARDIVFTQRGTLGQVSLVPNDDHGRYVVSQSQMRLRVDLNLAVPEFVYYAATTPDFLRQIDDRAISTGVPHTNLGILSELEVPLPPLPEQQAIAEVLGALDDKIAANTKLAATADEWLSTRYKVAVRADAATTPLLDDFQVDFGEPFGSAHFSEPGEGRPLIRIRDLKTFQSQVWTTEVRDREVVVQAGDIVVGMDAEFRATAWLGDPGLLNQRVCRFSHRTLGSALVREAIRTPLAEVESEKSATTVIHLNKSDIARKSALIPVGDALQSFENQAEPVFAARVSLAAENRTLAATRDALLPHLMSGKMRVRNAEKLASEAGA